MPYLPRARRGDGRGCGQSRDRPALSCIVRRSHIHPGAASAGALGDIVAEYRIDRCTAQSYEVKEGQYVQVIDVAGRQCSTSRLRCASGGQGHRTRPRHDDDALAARHDLSGAGSRRSSSTRTCRPWSRSSATPAGGKTIPSDWLCTSRFYEDAGYPGHPSCSENFNFALERFGLAKGQAGRR